MEQMERIERAAELFGKADGGYDDGAWCYLWSEVAKLAAAGLQASGVTLMRDESVQEPPEEIGELEHGWASTPVEVIDWCTTHGIPHEISGKAVILARFDSRPDKETRSALKAAGFRYVKARRVWEHRCFGSNDRPGNSVQAWRSGDRWEGQWPGKTRRPKPRRQPASWDAGDGGPGQDYVSAHQDLAGGIGGGW